MCKRDFELYEASPSSLLQELSDTALAPPSVVYMGIQMDDENDDSNKENTRVACNDNDPRDQDNFFLVFPKNDKENHPTLDVNTRKLRPRPMKKQRRESYVLSEREGGAVMAELRMPSRRRCRSSHATELSSPWTQPVMSAKSLCSELYPETTAAWHHHPKSEQPFQEQPVKLSMRPRPFDWTGFETPTRSHNASTFCQVPELECTSHCTASSDRSLDSRLFLPIF
ncbi:hypothetical protein ACA910_022003 [Epithemia clementina (nom. ined.)]